MQINLRAIRVIVVLLILLLTSSISYSQQYYKWVDENGVTHYGEVLPDANTKHVAFEFPQQHTTANAEDDYYSIQNQLQRMLERRKLESEIRARRETSAPVAQPLPVQYEEPRYAVGPLYHPVYYPHLKKKYKYGCKYGHNCGAPAPVHRKAIFHNRSSRGTGAKSGKVAKRGIHSGTTARTR